MFYRYTIALVLVAVAAGACSGSQNEGVSPGTAASTTTDTAVSTTIDAPVSTTAEFVLPSAVTAVSVTTIPVAATLPVVTAVPEAEVPPSAVLSSTTLAAGILTVTQDVILPEGVPMFAPDLTVEAAELVDVATEACRGAAVDPFGSGCAGAVWEVCYGVRSDIEKIRVAMGDRWDILSSDENSYYSSAFYYIRDTICGEAFTAEIAELGSVLVAKYGDRYYRETNSIIGEQGWVNDYRGDASAIISFKGELRDFADFRNYVDKSEWSFSFMQSYGLGQVFDLEEHISERAYAKIVPLVEVLQRNSSYYGLRFSTEPPAGFIADRVLRSVSEKEKIAESMKIEIADLPSSYDDISILCYDAVYAARINRNEWQNDIESCTIAAENCVEVSIDESESCSKLSVLARHARLELMWQQLPAICAIAEDIIYYNSEDACRRAAFDTYVYSWSELKDNWIYAPPTVVEAVFYLSQPLIVSNLPQPQRRAIRRIGF